MEPASSSTTSASGRMKRVLPARSRRGGPGVGNCDSDILILETYKRQYETEPIMPFDAKFWLTTNSEDAVDSPESSAAGIRLNTVANDRYFARPEVLRAFREQQLIQTPEFESIEESSTVGGRMRPRGAEDELAETSDAAYEKRHRKFETLEKRQRLREKEKLRHEHYKLKERIEQLRVMDSTAFMSVPASSFSPPPPQATPEMDEMVASASPYAFLTGVAHAEGERRRKEMLDTAYKLEKRYAYLLPPDRVRNKTVDSTPAETSKTQTDSRDEDSDNERIAHAAGLTKKDGENTKIRQYIRSSTSTTPAPSPAASKPPKKTRGPGKQTASSRLGKGSISTPSGLVPIDHRSHESSPFVDIEMRTPEPILPNIFTPSPMPLPEAPLPSVDADGLGFAVPAENGQMQNGQAHPSEIPHEPSHDIFVQEVAETAAVESLIAPDVEPIVTPSIEPILESVPDPVLTPILEPVVKHIPEPLRVVGPVVEPVTEAAMEPAVEHIVEPAVDPVVEPSVDTTSRVNVTDLPDSEKVSAEAGSIQVVPAESESEPEPQQVVEHAPEPVAPPVVMPKRRGRKPKNPPPVPGVGLGTARIIIPAQPANPNTESFSSTIKPKGKRGRKPKLHPEQAPASVSVSVDAQQESEGIAEISARMENAMVADDQPVHNEKMELPPIAVLDQETAEHATSFEPQAESISLVDRRPYKRRKHTADSSVRTPSAQPESSSAAVGKRRPKGQVFQTYTSTITRQTETTTSILFMTALRKPSLKLKPVRRHAWGLEVPKFKEIYEYEIPEYIFEVENQTPHPDADTTKTEQEQEYTEPVEEDDEDKDELMDEDQPVTSDITEPEKPEPESEDETEPMQVDAPPDDAYANIHSPDDFSDDTDPDKSGHMVVDGPGQEAGTITPHDSAATSPAPTIPDPEVPIIPRVISHPTEEEEEQLEW